MIFALSIMDQSQMGFANIAQIVFRKVVFDCIVIIIRYDQNWKDIEIRKGLFRVLPKECHQIFLCNCHSETSLSTLWGL